MRSLFLILVSLIIVGCGSESEPIPGGDIVDISDSVDNPLDSTVDEELPENTEDEYVPENIDGVWQIDDYAELYLNTKVYLNHDDIDYSIDGTYYYYSELDKKGGFANVTGAFEGWYEFVIWRMSGGTDLLGVMSAGCGPVCDYSFKWFIGDNGKLEDVGYDQIFPGDEIMAHKDVMYKKVLEKYPDLEYPDDVGLIYKFPKKGTAMEIDINIGAEEIQFPIMLLSWDKQRFSVAEFYNEVK